MDADRGKGRLKGSVVSHQARGGRGGAGSNVGINLFGTISFTARTVEANSLVGFTFFG